MRCITWPEKFFSADEQIRIVFAPKHTAAIAEIIFNARDSASHGLDYKKAATNVKRTVLVSQCHSLLSCQTVAFGLRIILCVAAGRLIDQPFANVPFVGVR